MLRQCELFFFSNYMKGFKIVRSVIIEGMLVSFLDCNFIN